jgi:tRNA (guanine-N7-)-methyltransferase
VSNPQADRDRPVRPIRSYVLRRSHFSAAQRDAYERLMPVFGLAYSARQLDLPAIFGRSAPTILEIGFGMGDTTAEIAAAHPEQDYVGVEVHTPGVGALLKQVEARGLSNVRVIEHDVQDVIDRQLPDGYLTGIHVFFPDPWPKARHHKRRLIQKHFVTKLCRKLRPEGYLHLATDWPDYAEQMIETVDAVVDLQRLAHAGMTALSPSDPAETMAGAAAAIPAPARSLRPTTKFEQRGLRLGHPICDILAVRRPPGHLQQSDTAGCQ